MRPVATSVGPLTEGLAKVLGQGLPVPAMPTAPVPQMQAQLPPQHYAQQPAGAPQMPGMAAVHGMSGLTVESLMSAVQRPATAQMDPNANPGMSLDMLRMEMFGRYYEELEGRMKELRTVLDGGVGRARKAMLERVDELGAALHRDMVALRQEVQKEVEDLKRDVFTTVMSVSAINDKIGLADSRNRETWIAVTKALTDRIDHQAKTSAEIVDRFRSGLDESLERRVVNVVETTLVRMADARRAQPENAASSPMTASTTE